MVRQKTNRTLGMATQIKPTANEQFCKSWVEVQNSTVVLLFSSSTKLNFSASISQPSQSCQTVTSKPNRRHNNDQTDDFKHKMKR